MKIGGGTTQSKKTQSKKTTKKRPMVLTEDDPFRILPAALDFEAAAKEKKKILQLPIASSPITIPERTRPPSPEVTAMVLADKLKAIKERLVEEATEKAAKEMEERLAAEAKAKKKEKEDMLSGDPDGKFPPLTRGYGDDDLLYSKQKYEKINATKQEHRSESLPPNDILNILKGRRGGKRTKSLFKKKRTKTRKKRTRKKRTRRTRKKRTRRTMRTRRRKLRKRRNTKRRRR
jgi:hypothetical protein